jgi:uncharacterized protein (UPF0333 family)
MFLKKRGQVSVEYLIVIGFVTLIVGVLLTISVMYRSQVNYQIRLNQVDEVARSVVDSAESVYYLGEPSRTTLKIYMPEGVDSIIINDNELFFKVRVQSGALTDIAYSTAANLTGSLRTSPGLREIKIESIGYQVNISDM